ncbi:MAG: amidase [Opitutus sp.]
MTFQEWQQLSPEKAGPELHQRAITRLSPAQQRAVFAVLPSEAELIAAFSTVDRSGPLGGVPFLVKDLFDVAGMPTFAGSTFLPEVRPASAEKSRLVQRFAAAGAVVAGKTQMHEFAYGITGENSHYGDCEHPRFPGRLTGGSSSGSAAAVAAGIVPLALGSDTGGSVRVPAAFCGLFGFRLTPGDEMIRDAFPLSPTCDTAGWFTSNAADMGTTIAAFLTTHSADREPVGCYWEMPELDPDVREACASAARKLAGEPDALTQTELKEAFHRSAEIYNHVVLHEAWQVHHAWAERYRASYDPGVWQRLERGIAEPPGQYNQAMAGVAAVRLSWDKFFRSFDFLVLPATPFGALTKAECTLSNRNRLLALTAPASLGGRPVLTLPVALPSGLTSGLQIVVKDVHSAVIPWALRRF